MDIYSDNLFKALSNQNNAYNFRCYQPATRFSKNQQAGRWAMRFARYFEYPAQVKRFKADLYHITEHGYAHLIKQLPAKRTIVSVHDLIPFLKHKNLIPGVKPERAPRLSEYSLSFVNKAAHIITISENSKKDLIQHLGCNEEKISVVYFGIPDAEPFNGITKSQARIDLNLPDTDQKLILVCGQDFYKNHETSIDVFNTLCKKHNLRLVHLGQENEIWRAAKARCDHPELINELSNLSNTQLMTLYRAVDCILFPSWYEGFGLPPLEAMSCGTPAVTSNAASLCEAVGPSTPTAQPDDVEALSFHVEEVLYNTPYRQDVIQAGLIHAKQFNWQRCATQTLDIYEKVLHQ